MHRFYCPNLPADAATPILSDVPVELEEEQARHARSVLRLKAGQEIMLFDGQGRTAQAVVLDPGKTFRVSVRLVRTWPRPRLRLVLAVAPPKGGRLEDMVDQLSQLGVDHVDLLRTARSVVEPGAGKQRRLERAVIESAKQCGRPWLMTVGELRSLPDVLDEPADLTLLAQPGAAAQADLSAKLAAGGVARALVGPEGGFTDDESALALARGAVAWSLGPHILRIETAAVAAAAVLGYLRGDRD